MKKLLAITLMLLFLLSCAHPVLAATPERMDDSTIENHEANIRDALIEYKGQYTYKLNMLGKDEGTFVFTTSPELVDTIYNTLKRFGMQMRVVRVEAEKPSQFGSSAAEALKSIKPYKGEKLKGTVQFRLAKGDMFRILGIAETGRALYIEYEGRQGYIAVKDILFIFDAGIKATATKKASAYIKLDNGKLKRVGYYDKGKELLIQSINGSHITNNQAEQTYWLKTSEWTLSN